MLFAQLQLAPDQASTAAEQVDPIFWFVTLVVAFFTVLIAFLVIYFGVKYRRRSPDELPIPIKGSLKLEIGWTIVPLLIGLFIFFWSAQLLHSRVSHQAGRAAGPLFVDLVRGNQDGHFRSVLRRILRH